MSKDEKRRRVTPWESIDVEQNPIIEECSCYELCMASTICGRKTEKLVEPVPSAIYLPSISVAYKIVFLHPCDRNHSEPQSLIQ